MTTIETDYLVVGAGAVGIAFADEIVARTDAEVVLVDRRHAPGGHWNDAYPFVRLHQPSANYGVNSRVLGGDTIDSTGPNTGFYERATGAEICDYYRKVLDALVATGQLRFLGGHDYAGDWADEHTVRSSLTGLPTPVRVRRKIVDATFSGTEVPTRHTPTFSVDAGARCIPVGELVEVGDAPDGFTILGSGKTAMDACVWLLENGVDPGRIRWVRPRDAWLFDRAGWQPRDLVAGTMEALSLDLEALAEAESLDDLFARLEAYDQLHRLDPGVPPTMFRGAITSEGERAAMRQVERVVRLGHVRRVGTDRVVLADGEIPTSPGELHVDCTAYGFAVTAPRPIFEPRRITPQSTMGGFATFSAALVGFVEASRDDDVEKNRLLDPTHAPSRPADWIPTFCGGFRSFGILSAEPDAAAWLAQSRLSLTGAVTDHMDDPRLQAAFARYATNLEPALKNGDELLKAAAA